MAFNRLFTVVPCSIIRMFKVEYVCLDSDQNHFAKFFIELDEMEKAIRLKKIYLEAKYGKN